MRLKQRRRRRHSKNALFFSQTFSSFVRYSLILFYSAIPVHTFAIRVHENTEQLERYKMKKSKKALEKVEKKVLHVNLIIHFKACYHFATIDRKRKLLKCSR
jgi:hypothetical protein